jgi:hypothetical protein
VAGSLRSLSPCIADCAMGGYRGSELQPAGGALSPGYFLGSSFSTHLQGDLTLGGNLSSWYLLSCT